MVYQLKMYTPPDPECVDIYIAILHLLTSENKIFLIPITLLICMFLWREKYVNLGAPLNTSVLSSSYIHTEDLSSLYIHHIYFMHIQSTETMYDQMHSK